MDNRLKEGAKSSMLFAVGRI